MIIMHSLNEDRLEELYWLFDTERKKSGMERDAFKHAMRLFAREALDRAGVIHDIELPE